MKGRDELAGQQRRLADAGDERSERQAASAVAARHLDFGLEGQQGRHAIGRRRGVADVARDRAGILDLAAADLARRLLQPVEQGRQAGFDQFAPGRRGAQAPAVGGFGNAAKGRNCPDVENVFGDGPSDAGRIEVGPARKHHEGSGQCLESLFKASGSEIGAHIVRVRTMTQDTYESND